MLRINQIKIRITPENAGDTKEAEASLQRALRRKAAAVLHIREDKIKTCALARRSIDARKKPDLFYSCTADVEIGDEEKVFGRLKNRDVALVQPSEYCFPYQIRKLPEELRPVIVGSGPAGLFCAYFLARAGFAPVLLERGKEVGERRKDVEEFWRGGPLKQESNVAFGEGGAGTFSDGKLNTLVKDSEGRSKAVLSTFVQMGAKKSILYDSKPHIGTDVLCRVVENMRKEILHAGGSVRFQSKVTGICQRDGRLTGVIVNGEEEIRCRRAVLAIGHSARDTFEMLLQAGIPMEPKAFAVGFRVEHPQAMIDLLQYGREDRGPLGAAPYKVAAKTKSGRGVYSFCMCPGGYVINASSEDGRLCINGMSYSDRGGENANSAVIVSVTPEDFGGTGPLSGVAFQRRLEERAYALGQGKIPVQTYGEFKRRIEDRYPRKDACSVGNDGQTEESTRTPGSRTVRPQNRGGSVSADLSGILSEECSLAFVEGMTKFGRMMPGFDREDAVLSGVESRTSSPVRILRSDEMHSCGLYGLYPCGEGAGYAGGITSAAMDGIRAAEAVARDLLTNDIK